MKTRISVPSLIGIIALLALLAAIILPAAPARAGQLVEIDFATSASTTWTNTLGRQITINRIDATGDQAAWTNVLSIIMQVPVAALGVATNEATRSFRLLNAGTFIGSTNITPTHLELDIGTSLLFTNTMNVTTNTILLNID
jgi:hypothetical protein